MSQLNVSVWLSHLGLSNLMPGTIVPSTLTSSQVETSEAPNIRGLSCDVMREWDCTGNLACH